MKEKIYQISGYAVAAILALITVYDLFCDLFQTNIAARISILSISLSLIFAHLLLERTLFKNDDDNVVKIKTFNSSGDFYLHYKQLLEKAKSSVDDLTHGLVYTTVRTTFDRESHTKYINVVPEITNRKALEYREVMSFPNGNRIKKAKEMIEAKLPNYKLRYYDLTPEEHESCPPVMQFFIIDSKYLLLGSHSGKNENTNETYMCISGNERILNYFQEYFDSIWRGAQPIQTIQELDKIKKDVASKKKGKTQTYNY